MIKKITEFSEIENHIEHIEVKSLRIIFKHSDTCPVSVSASEVIKELSEKFVDLPILMLEVKSQRDLSNKIETHFETRHESPQVLLFKGDKLKEVRNHFSITLN